MNIQTIQQKTASIFHQYGITYAAIFGSFSRGDETGKSDIDFLIRMGKPMGIVQYMRFIETLESSLKRKVDIVTENSINKHLKPYIMSDIKTIYEN